MQKMSNFLITYWRSGYNTTLRAKNVTRLKEIIYHHKTRHSRGSIGIYLKVGEIPTNFDNTAIEEALEHINKLNEDLSDHEITLS